MPHAGPLPDPAEGSTARPKEKRKHTRKSAKKAAAPGKDALAVYTDITEGPVVMEGPLKILSVPISFLSFWVRWDSCFVSLRGSRLLVYGDATDKQDENYFLALDLVEQKILVLANPKENNARYVQNSFTVYVVGDSGTSASVFAQFQASSQEEMEKWTWAITSRKEELDLKSGVTMENEVAIQLASRRLHLSRTASRLSTFGTVLDRQEVQPIQEEGTLRKSPSGVLAAPNPRAASPIIAPTNGLPDWRVPAREQEVRSSTSSPLRQSVTSLNRLPTENAKEFEVLAADHIMISTAVAGPADAGDASEDLGSAEGMETDQFNGGDIQSPRSKKSKRLRKQREKLTYEQAALSIQSFWKGSRVRREYLLRRKRTITIQAYVRRHLAKRALNSIRRECMVAKFQPKRTRVLMELYATEMSYVSDLDTAIRVFLKPLRALFETPTSKKGGIGREQIAAIFSNVEEIAEKHHGFVEALGKLVESWGENERLGPLFMDMSRWLYVYVPYCNNYEVSHNTLAKCRKVPAFQNFLDTVGNFKLCKRLDISAFLIVPVQRIPRYELLLKELVKNTWEDHPDMADLKTALHRIHESAKLVNRAKQLNESRERIAELTSRLKLQYPLATEHRRYLGEGPVLYIGPNADRPLAAYLFLFNDQMLVTKRHYDRKKLKSHTTKFSCVCNIPLGGAAMANGSLTTGEVTAISPDTPNSRLTSPTKEASLQMFRYSFVLHITTVAAGGLTLVHQFFTNAQETRDKWISDLSEALQENAANPSVADITKLLALGDDEDEISVRTAPLSGGISGDDDDWSGSGMAGSGGWSRAVSSENLGGKGGLVKIDRWNSWDSVTLLGGNKVRRQA